MTGMKALDEKMGILRKHKGQLQREYKLRQIGIFGSYARGKERKKSDIDVLVEFSETPGLVRFMDLEHYLARLLGAKVDLVTKRALKPRIGARILQEVMYV